jgi:hypothetical protein
MGRPVDFHELPRFCLAQPTPLHCTLKAGPAAGAAATEQAFAAPVTGYRVTRAIVYPSAVIAQDAADPSTITLQSGADVIGTVTNAAAGGIPAAGLALTLAAAEVTRADGDPLKLVATNAGVGAQDLSSTALTLYVETVPA